MVGAVLFAPFTGELWLTLTNAQWFGALLLVALLAAAPPATVTGAVAWSLGAIVMGLSGPFATLLWPWFGAAAASSWMTIAPSVVSSTTCLFCSASGVRFVV